METENKVHRRQVIGGIGATLAAATISPAMAGLRHTSASEGAGELVDPTKKYPKPPFPAQSQPWPGLVSKMDPRPDHGETSYKGSGRLTGRRALITGGDSGMGRGGGDCLCP